MEDIYGFVLPGHLDRLNRLDRTHTDRLFTQKMALNFLLIKQDGMIGTHLILQYSDLV